MSAARRGAVAATANGQVLVYGGSSVAHVPDAGYRRILERYDPLMDTWSELAPGEPRADMGAAVVNDVMYTFGGNNVSQSLEMVRSYDSGTNSWSVEVSLPESQSYMRAEVVDGRIYVFGTNDTFEFCAMTRKESN